MPALTEFAPAKLNLALHVRARNPDGYHDLESIFAFVDFGDTLHLTPAEVLSLTIDGPFAAALVDDDNLVLRAVRALADASGRPAAGRLRLEKHIPVAAGLGGGSADAAAALRLLARSWQLDWPPARLAEIASGLGADVPACLYGSLQFGTGRGDQLAPMQRHDLAGTPVLLVNPRVAVATGPVFRGWDGIDRGTLDPAAPLAVLRNDLAAPAIALAPVIATVIAALEQQPGVTLVRMSGSGATVFALFESDATRNGAVQQLSAQFPDWWLTGTALH
ncbi:4-(cytidine 5'-diphospho)-2-C-methyl-D-erythritol kinase [Polymorphobacter arshaanensis]|uniref:4-diphosphocytidyl-2-C-methyl-D-erythritol kinase n=1 Tax=Glacieibacterium arshaanense TaxID=2511025 RepID=A0A4Y9ERX2_9SPHN|nr:4-(cytidine 5'-diphospho)-2-C-methyl-D-erythritol kinase [Polymorphobacter arshaanensis]TFU06387.1 4-(cytidine 5'-diphospho)-2-C-methyl-D-erythritol kinase [Polymorphobacter arshaanensis]